MDSENANQDVAQEAGRSSIHQVLGGVEIQCPNGCDPKTAPNPNPKFCAMCNNTGWVKPEDIPPKRVTIEELETMLASKEPLDIEIQPDGSIRAVPKGTAVNADVKPITMKYAVAVAEYY